MQHQTSLSNEEQFILLCARITATSPIIKQIKALINLNLLWDNIENLAKRNGVAPLIYKTLTHKKLAQFVPEAVLKRFSKYYYQSLTLNLYLLANLKTVTDKFAEANIETIILKGALLSTFVYGDIGLRPMSDLDILVRKQDIEKAVEVLLSLQYTTEIVYQGNFQQSRFHQLAPFVSSDKHTMIELHRHIVSDDLPYNIDITKYWSNSVVYQANDLTTCRFSAENLLQHLCVHIEKHYDEGIRYGWLCDIAELVKKYNSEINWNYLISSSFEQNIVQAVYKNLLLCKHYLDVQMNFDLEALNPNATEYDFNRLLCSYISNEGNKAKGDKYIHNFLQIKGMPHKFRFLLDDFFPSPQYMIQRYKIRKRYLLAGYYIVRFFVGVYRIIRYFVSFQVK